MTSDYDRLQQHAKRVDEGVDAWFAREVPSIVAGLEASQFIGPVTAETAWDLIASGCAEEALTLVLSEVDESWRD